MHWSMKSSTIYCSIYQIQSGATTRAVFIVRTADRDVSGLASAMRRTIWSVDAGVPVFDIRPMTDIVARSLGVRRFVLALLSAFGVVALALAVVGLYSVLSYAVAQRTPERVTDGLAVRQLRHRRTSRRLPARDRSRSSRTPRTTRPRP